MTSFFDDAEHAVHCIAGDHPDIGFDDYLKCVADIEKPVIETVLLNTGDREFPDDMREKILSIIATQAVYQHADLPIPDAVRRRVLGQKLSPCLTALHSAFHELARLRVKTRWGHWSDSPRQNLVSRDSHDAESAQ